MGPDLLRSRTSCCYTKPPPVTAHTQRSTSPGPEPSPTLAHAQVMGPDLSRGSKLLVFCNSVDSSRAVEHFCREQGMATVCYNGEMTVAARQESMAKFEGEGRWSLRQRS